MLLSERNDEISRNRVAWRGGRFRGVQGYTPGEVGDPYNNEDQTFHNGWRQKRNESHGGQTGQCRERKSCVLALLHRLSWTRRTEHGRALCGSDGTACSSAEFAAGAIVYGRAVALDCGKWDFPIGYAGFEGNPDGERVVVDRCLFAPLAGGR